MQTLDDLQHYLLSKLGTSADCPFDDATLVARVRRKIFALIATDHSPLRVNLKCDPVEAEALRAEFPAVLPGHHMNKRHWNTVILDGSIPEDRIREMIDDSYSLVVAGLSKDDREGLPEKKPRQPRGRKAI